MSQTVGTPGPCLEGGSQSVDENGQRAWRKLNITCAHTVTYPISTEIKYISRYREQQEIKKYLTGWGSSPQGKPAGWLPKYCGVDRVLHNIMHRAGPTSVISLQSCSRSQYLRPTPGHLDVLVAVFLIDKDTYGRIALGMICEISRSGLLVLRDS